MKQFRNFTILTLGLFFVLNFINICGVEAVDLDDEIIVIFKQGLELSNIYGFLREYKLKPLDAFKYGVNITFLVKFKDEKLSNRSLSVIKKDWRVENCLPNFKLDLQSDEVDEIIEGNKDIFDNFFGYVSNFDLSNDSETTIIYLDSGLNIPLFVEDHPNLYKIGLGNAEGYGFDLVNASSPPDPGDYDSEGEWESAFKSWLATVDKEPEDKVGHGTFGASLGLIYAPNCRILPIKITDQHDNFGLFPFINAVKLVNYLIETGELSGRVVLNMSASTLASQTWESNGEEYDFYDFQDWFNDVLFEPLRDKDTVMLAAGHRNERQVEEEVFPAFLDGIMMIEREEFVEDSPVGVDMFAPGIAYSYDLGGVNIESGSSVSTFIVSAVTGNILRINPDLNRKQVETILKSNTFESGIFNLALEEIDTQKIWSILDSLRIELSEDLPDIKVVKALYSKLIQELNTAISTSGLPLHNNILKCYKYKLEDELDTIEEGMVDLNEEDLFVFRLFDELVEENKLDALRSIRTGTVYSALNLIKYGIDDSDIETINRGFEKLIYDVSYQDMDSEFLDRMRVDIISSLQREESVDSDAIVENLIYEFVISSQNSYGGQDQPKKSNIDFIVPSGVSYKSGISYDYMDGITFDDLIF